ncbi:MAG TPA: tetratricopeptide repeat protein [Pyrinomonadaceae bacterium]|nr:tetratricopeptide repeat protein [Pyrinomonadaceae bacterium]
MSLQKITSEKLDLIISSIDEEVKRSCLSAKELEAAGEYEAARAAIGDRWSRVGERPNLDGLHEGTQAELLLRAGTLTGWIGSAQQIDGAQEVAKDLISESARRFERLGFTEKVADAHVDLAVCYWRAGALDEARVTLHDVLDRVGEETSEPRLRSLANLALLERVAGRYREALKIQTQAAPLFKDSNNHALRGNFHNVCAQVLKELGLEEQREDYIDQALMEYTAASYHFEAAGHARFQGRIENNLGSLFASIGRYDQAHEHLNNARSLFVKLRDKGMVAHVDETSAKTLLADGHYEEAEKAIRNSVRVFEEGDERSAFAEALTTQGLVFARLKQTDDALASFKRAIVVSEQAGDSHSKGLAALTLIEELVPSVPTSALRDYYDLAELSLSEAQNVGVRLRLGECARRILTAEKEAGMQSGFQSRFEGPQSAPAKSASIASQHDAMLSCSLEAEVLSYEGELIRRALATSGGSVTRAARLLGITHQGLAFILNGRHKNLLSARKPVKPRRRSIIRYH